MEESVIPRCWPWMCLHTKTLSFFHVQALKVNILTQHCLLTLSLYSTIAPVLDNAWPKSQDIYNCTTSVILVSSIIKGGSEFVLSSGAHGTHGQISTLTCSLPRRGQIGGWTTTTAVAGWEMRLTREGGRVGAGSLADVILGHEDRIVILSLTPTLY